MNPLDTNGELKQEGSEDEGEEMFYFSVGQSEHDHSEGVADEHTKEVLESLDVLSGVCRERLDALFDKGWYCEEVTIIIDG